MIERAKTDKIKPNASSMMYIQEVKTPPSKMLAPSMQLLLNTPIAKKNPLRVIMS